jgi:hypothetical protein
MPAKSSQFGRVYHREYERKGVQLNAPSAPVSVHGQRGESPLQVYALRPVTERNCVTVRWGGEQREVNDQSVG